MNSYFFNPQKTEIPENLILLPFMPDKDYLKRLEDTSLGRKHILGSTLYSFDYYSVLYGFLGYSNLLTVLEFIAGIRNKNVYFIGTAGSLNPSFEKPEILSVKKIYPGSIFNYFTDDDHYELKETGIPGLKKGIGISIDLIQRENSQWYREMKSRKIDFVEMELFPLKWYLGNQLSALVILSDLVTETGIVKFKRKKINEEFIKGFELIKSEIK